MAQAETSVQTPQSAVGTKVAERFCCRFNVHSGVGGVILHADYWPRCKSCSRQSGHLKSLFYTRSDGVAGMSYPDCFECRGVNAGRLERLGFTITGNDPRAENEGS